MAKIKYLITFIISLGFTLMLVFGVEYNCEGREMFPTYYGSPFIFKQKSLGSSMEYYYSVFGLLLNVVVWGALITLIDFGVKKLIAQANSKVMLIGYKVLIGLLLLFCILNITITYIFIGHGFKENLNYWYWNFDKEASIWGMTCNGEWKFFIK
ncbi:MAG TPA: hypothetical protein VN698_09130 [Bacteroidia bacterium]|nr:hypothetical protein [Bacteroidia bacterium]